MRLFPALLCAVTLAAAAAGCGGDGGEAPSSGEQLYREYACSSCHSLDGSDGTGPTFQGLAGSTVTLEGGGQVRATPEYLRRAIVEPEAQVVDGYNAGLMTATVENFDLARKPEDVRKLVEFIQGVQ